MRRLLAQFWAAIDAETITVFQAVFGVAFILCGFNGIFFSSSQPPITLRGQLDHATATLWYGLLLTGTLVCLVGKMLRGQLIYTGMLLQFFGDLMVFLALLAYITGTVRVEPFGTGGFGAYAASALWASAALFVTRDVRRLAGIEKRVRHEPS
ncbi:hypothetical protein [Mycobacterium asiaticum]|uniref:hypothetical protein n=1 Tax=Mycobacterium asiaticum TaxID=1790 RepID=UPI0007EF09E4|nr:hypothetical protein [Mycobacterium asiaticum]OBJ50625.1 hypothetical protein A9W94_28160 [Mycobacterium asiaticum]